MPYQLHTCAHCPPLEELLDDELDDEDELLLEDEDDEELELLEDELELLDDELLDDEELELLLEAALPPPLTAKELMVGVPEPLAQ